MVARVFLDNVQNLAGAISADNKKRSSPAGPADERTDQQDRQIRQTITRHVASAQYFDRRPVRVCTLAKPAIRKGHYGFNFPHILGFDQRHMIGV